MILALADLDFTVLHNSFHPSNTCFANLFVLVSVPHSDLLPNVGIRKAPWLCIPFQNGQKVVGQPLLRFFM